jgi:hypothetical protein
MVNLKVVDIHMHIQPWRQFKPNALALMQRDPEHFAQMKKMCDDPQEFLKYLDSEGIYAAGLVNYVAPEVMGFQDTVCEFITEYCKADPDRLIPIGSAHPQFTPNIEQRMDQIIEMGIRIFKVHPPHQCIYPNAYRNGDDNLRVIYEKCEAANIPVIIHTGTSVFPGARNVYADPIYLDDVAIDFPKLNILLAHGGRPLWMETAFFLLRRHKNIWLDLSGIPPLKLLEYFPRFEQIAHKSLFGTDWPGPGVPSMRGNVEQFLSLSLSDEVKQDVLYGNAARLLGWTQQFLDRG